MFKIKIKDGLEEKSITACEGENLYMVLARNNIYTSNFCGGNHSCGKCRVIVNSKFDLPLEENERSLLKRQNAHENERLACFIEVKQDIDIEIPKEADKGKIIVEGLNNEFKFNPIIGVLPAKAEEPSLGNQRDDLSRLVDSLGNNDLRVSYSALLKIPGKIYRNNGQISCVVMDNEILDIKEACNSQKVYGIAVDIGTTTLAAYLLDLEDGKQIDVYSSLNPQRVYGGDVISRINHTIDSPETIIKLKELIIDEINKITGVFCRKNNIDRNDIYVMSFAGNTTMIHMLLGVSAENIANAPFIPVFTDSIKIKAEKIGLNINPAGAAIILPCLSGYIGADTIAAVLACGMADSDDICLMLDIGTNGEIVLGNKNGMVCCSAAAGPAFEGANITFGIGGIEGAIDHVKLDNGPIYSTIHDKPPVGICGSGIVDVISEFLKFGIIDKTGRMIKKNEFGSVLNGDISKRVIDYNGSAAFLLDEETGICITQKDIRQVQLAKAAIYGGIKVLINELGIKTEDIKKVYLAGGFGNYISVESAAKIGIFPYELQDKVISAGNAAGTGAKIVLRDIDAVTGTYKLKKKMKYIELSCSSKFQDEYIDAMGFYL